jgi:hypothetical protein
MLKSENEEALNDIRILKAKAGRTKQVGQNEYCDIPKSRKQWLKDALIAAQNQQIKEIETTLRDLKKVHEYWQNKYCALAAGSLK